MLRAHKKSNNSLPQLSYIPTCFYGEEANLFWHTRDYSRNDVWASHMTKEEYMSGLKNLPGNDFYKYPKCKKFSPKPTDSAICHTFNGLELSKILKSSSWRENFLDAFTQGETPETPPQAKRAPSPNCAGASGGGLRAGRACGETRVGARC